jgi:hypothetical protein
MEGAGRVYEGEERCIPGFGIVKHEEKRKWEDLVVWGRILK